MTVATTERDKRLNVFRAVAYAALPGTIYVSLHSADPGVTGASEIAGNGYARVALAVASGSFSAPATNGAVREIANLVSVIFPVATADWAQITHVGFWDSLTGGVFLRGDALGTPLTVTNGKISAFSPGALVLNET